MGTTVKTIRKDGTGDYTTLQSWEDAAPANLVTDGNIWQGQCTVATDEFTSASSILTMSGSTADATHYKELTTGTGASFKDNVNVQTNALRYNASNGVAIRVTTGATSGINLSENYARINNIQFKTDYVASYYTCMSLPNTGCIIKSCIIESLGSHGALVGTLKLTGGATAINCLIIMRRSAADSIITGNNQAGTLLNCTIVCPSDIAVKTTNGISSNYSTQLTRNCAIFGCTNVKAGSSTYTFTTCYTDVAAPPAGCTTVTYTNQFQDTTDATRDFRLKTGADCLDAGTTDSANAATDIAGTARPQGSAYDVGCWEYVVPGYPRHGDMNFMGI